MSNPLDRLSELYGILPGYNDIWGNTHLTSNAARRALLRAMGVPADSKEEVAASLGEFERRRWKQPLPPVQVLRETEPAAQPCPCHIPVALPLSEDRKSYRWHLRRESGGEDRGEFIPERMEELERGDVDGQTFVRRALPLPLTLEPGYHRLGIERVDGVSALGEMQLIIAPAACYQPPALQGGGRAWGFALQLYGLRSERNYGMGDFSDLCRLVEFCVETGAARCCSTRSMPCFRMPPNTPVPTARPADPGSIPSIWTWRRSPILASAKKRARWCWRRKPRRSCARCAPPIRWIIAASPR